MSNNIRNMKNFVERKEMHEAIERERKTLNDLALEEYRENAVLTSAKLLEQSQVVDQMALDAIKRDNLDKSALIEVESD